MSDLYTSGWSPRGVRKDWERCSMDLASTDELLGRQWRRPGITMREAIAWFDRAGRLRRLIVDYADNRRTDVRADTRGGVVFVIGPIR